MTRTLSTLAIAILLSACGDSGDGAAPGDPGGEPAPTSPIGPEAPDPTTAPPTGTPSDDTPGQPAVTPPTNLPPEGSNSGITEPSDLFDRDGYGTVDVVRVDIRTLTTPGTCTVDDESGCTLADVIADVDPTDELKVDIPVHFSASDFPDDGLPSNAEMRQRGASARLASRKSFRVDLKGKGVRWRNEDRIQLNKHPYDDSAIRNKLAFDLMADIPNLPSSRTQFVELWIDDGQGPVDYGIYTHDEAAAEEFLANRGWDTDGNLYKAEKFLFSEEDLRFMELDAEGAPIDEDAFESRIEIKNGEDHRKLVEMIRAVNDASRPFEETFARYFDEENVLTWTTVNFLLHQVDAITHNYYLYNPAGSDKFYFLPWDYDDTFAVQELPPEGFETSALEQRLFFGYARGSASNLIKKYYMRPDTHRKVLAKADELRRGPLMDATISALATRYAAVVAPVATREPDRSRYGATDHTGFAGAVARSEELLRTSYSIPMAPGLSEPRIENGQVRFLWSPATDVTGGAITYDLEIASSPDFEPGTQLLTETGIADDVVGGIVTFDVPLSRLPSGRHYARLVARSDRDPTRFWQIASSRTSIGGVARIGIREFTVP